MGKLLGVLAAAVALGLLVAPLGESSAIAQGGGVYIRLLFTPQAGVNTANNSCGWHEGACDEDATRGPALDFGAIGTDTQTVYFRAYGFKPSGTQEQVARGTPFTDEYATCKTTYVNIYDLAGHLLGTMLYTHAYRTATGNMMLYASPTRPMVQYAFAAMAKEPWDGTIPEGERENWACYNNDWWGGRHLHEYHTNGADTFFLRDGGDCTYGDKYPCVPAAGGYYNPQDLDDWARTFCIDDTDCDGWTEGEESYLGTDPLDDCPNSSSHDAWPLDINKDRYITVSGDMAKYSGRIGATPGSPNWWQRLDLNADGYITVSGDMAKYSGKIGQSCYN